MWPEKLDRTQVAVPPRAMKGDSAANEAPEPAKDALPSTQLPNLVSAQDDREAHARTAREREIAARFEQAVSMLHMRQYDYALAALHRVLELAPEMPEAHVNMGYALLGLEQYGQAYDFFQGATVLRPDQSNAYYGMAVALEGLGDLQGALGAMRTFIHLSPPDNPFLERARAALWEWERELDRKVETAASADEDAVAEMQGVADASEGKPVQGVAVAPQDEKPAD